MAKSYYAKDAFPWVYPGKPLADALTLAGLIEQRHTTHRRLWAQVLAGTDEQLIDAAERLNRISPENNGISNAEARAFYATCIQFGMTEDLLVNGFCPKDPPLLFFCAGLRHREAQQE